MIQVLGTLSLLTALFLALLQSFLPLLGYYRRNVYLLAFARPCAIGQFIFIALAYIALTIAFVTNDFSLSYVAANSHPTLPFMYRLTALWGAHEGSILLWVFMLSGWSVVFALFSFQEKSYALILSMLGLISVSFLAFLLLTSNPFLSAIGIQAGKDLNPLLQDPGFVTHPPMLYAGYVGFSVAFAITLGALLKGKLDAAWASCCRRYAIAAWAFLTLGITLGSWWAYRVLGWGGFWFWDPVENASLLPWLSGTALIHVLLLAEKRGKGQAWAALLAIISFGLSLLGTFLVRSGVLISAHTFATDPERGVFLLLLLGLLVGLAFTLFFIRAKHISLQTPTSASSPFARETSLLLNSFLLFVAMCTILLGTLYPLIVEALQLGAISVGAPYFNAVMGPLVLVILFFMGFGPLSKWQQQSFSELLRLATKKMLVSLLFACILLWSVMGQIDAMTLISLTLSFWIILSVSKSFRILPGMTLAHIGFALLVIGIMLSSLLNQEKEARVKPGDVVELGPYQFLFIDTQAVSGSNFKGIQAAFDVIKNKRHVTNLYPEKRIYTVRQMVMTTVDIHPGIFRDLYIALGEPFADNMWSLRVYYKPFIRFIWVGGIIMILGAVLTLLQRGERNAFTKI